MIPQPSMPSTPTGPTGPIGPVSPWWRHGLVWLVISGPLLVVLASLTTLAIALAYPDPVLPLRAQAPAQQPAVQARNHAAAAAVREGSP